MKTDPPYPPLYSPPVQIDRLGPGAAYRTRLLTPEDLRDLQGLFERASDYFEIATGRPPAKDEAPRAFVGGPPTKAVTDKRTIGVFTRENALVGVLDAITDWPAEGVWTMGLLLLDPVARRGGLGRATLAAYEAWAASLGARAFRTAVVAHHEPGLHFLEKAGYQRENTLPDHDPGAGPATVVFLTKQA